MGDRGNIAVRQYPGKGKDVWFYTHWSGSGMEEVLQAAMIRGQGRWGDPDYLARIIFCELVKGNEDDVIGFGISTSMADNEHPILVVDVPNQQVLRLDEDELKHDGNGVFTLPDDLSPFDAVPFEEFKGAGFAALK